MYGTYIQSSIIHTIDNQPTIHNHPQSTQFHPSTTQIIPNTTNTTLNFHNITPSILSLYTPLHIYPVPFIPILQQYKTYTLHTLLPPLHTIPPSVLPPTILDHTFLPPLLPPLTTTNHQTHTRYPTTIAHCLPDCRPVTGGQQLGLSASFKTFRIQKLRLLLTTCYYSYYGSVCLDGPSVVRLHPLTSLYSPRLTPPPTTKETHSESLSNKRQAIEAAAKKPQTFPSFSTPLASSTSNVSQSQIIRRLHPSFPVRVPPTNAQPIARSHTNAHKFQQPRPHIV